MMLWLMPPTKHFNFACRYTGNLPKLSVFFLNPTQTETVVDPSMFTLLPFAARKRSLCELTTHAPYVTLDEVAITVAAATGVQ